MHKLREYCFAAMIWAFGSCSSRHALAQQPVGETQKFAWRVEPFYRYRSDAHAGRAVSIALKDATYNGPLSVKVICNKVAEKTELHKNDTLNRYCLLLPAGAGVDTAVTAELTVSYGSKTDSAVIFIPRLKQWTVYIYPHSHLDIGYTALPADVEKLQVRNIDVGIDLAEKTQHYPEGARFVWNPEATWTVRNYLRGATMEKRQRFIEAVRKGWIQIDAGHSNMNTSTCSDEELLRFFDNSKEIGKLTGVAITTMVQMDVPGAAWGLVTAAAQYGIRGMISFPNNFDLRKQWEHRPFYWLAPDGKTKLLFLQGYPYGIGYTIKGSKYGLTKLQTYSDAYDHVQTTTPSVHFLDPFIFNETAKLEKEGSPYDLFAMTWSMADNCVIDADLPEAVKAWNENYAYPKLVISGAKGILDAYEKKYGSIIPHYQGDYTECWTNGLGSDAASVGKGRTAKENLIQAETLWALLQPGKMPATKFRQAWENNLLSAEHTWGAQHSGSLLAQQVSTIKAAYFSNAEEESKSLIAEAASPYTDTTVAGFSVINTLSWKRNGIVTLTPGQSVAGDLVLDDHQLAVPSQRLSTGELIFLAEAIPALGSRYYRIVAGKPAAIATNTFIDSTLLKNDLIALQIDPGTGNIRSVKSIAGNYEYVDSTLGLNAFYYLPGVYNGKDHPGTSVTASLVSISIKERGPLLVSATIRSTAAGAKYLTREIRLYDHTSSVEIVNTLDKIPTREKEGVHFGFDFHLPGAVNRIEMPWSIVRPDTDQLKGANKNWFAFQRWVDISNNKYGITWSAIESPLLEWGKLSGNILDGARQSWLWQKQVPATANFYSWVLNNHWDTNFPLEQGGIIKETYAIAFHGGYDVTAANRFGLKTHRPLIVVQAKKNIIEKPMFQIDNPKIVISTLQSPSSNRVFMLRVKSISEKAEPLRLTWVGKKPKEIVECTIDDQPVAERAQAMQVEPYGTTNLKLVF